MPARLSHSPQRPVAGRQAARLALRRRRSRGGRGLRRGAAAVEFAMVLPLLLTLFVICLDLARALSLTQVVTDGARMGAMYASHPDLADKTSFESVQQAVQAATGDLHPPPEIRVAEGVDRMGQPYAEVTVSCPFRLACGWARIRDLRIERTVRVRIWPEGDLED